MKSKFSPILWLIVAAFVCQGTLPGLVMCFGEAGHVELERARDGYCDDKKRRVAQERVAVFTHSNASTDQDSCGPCTDTAILPSPTTRPSTASLESDAATTCTILVLAPVTNKPPDYVTSPYTSADASFIPISTTTLLI